MKAIVRRLGRTSLGKNLIHAAVLRDPASMRFRNVERWPRKVRGVKLGYFNSGLATRS